MKAHELQERLMAFTVSVIKITDKLPNSTAAKNLARQLARSSTSVSLNYGEAQAGETRKDFVHKMKIVLKELNETQVGLELIYRLNLTKEKDDLIKVAKENSELIAIFTASINTASKKL